MASSLIRRARFVSSTASVLALALALSACQTKDTPGGDGGAQDGTGGSDGEDSGAASSSAGGKTGAGGKGGGATTSGGATGTTDSGAGGSSGDAATAVTDSGTGGTATTPDGGTPDSGAAVTDPANEVDGTVVWREGFETTSDWSVENGVFAIGAPTAATGPAAHGGKNVGGTGLKNAYPDAMSSRLVSQVFTVPAKTDLPRVRYWYWYDFGAGDYGQLQIKIAGGSWQILDNETLNGSGEGWNQRIVDLTTYAGQSVQLGFFAYANGGTSNTNLGLFIDDVSLETGATAFGNGDGFESGFGNWSVESGVWSIGVDTAPKGPKSHSGKQVAATVLAGAYPDAMSSRLASPEFVVPAKEQTPRIRYWYYSDFGAGDYGQLQVRVVGGSWQILDNETVNLTGQGYAQRIVDLSAYEKQTIQIGFFAYANGGTSNASLGYYIDDVSLEVGPMKFVTPQGFENGFSDWSVEDGVWTIGAPKAPLGPTGAHGGKDVAGTTIAGSYPDAMSARLASPSFTVAPKEKNPRLRYWSWYDFGSGDYANLQIRIAGGQWQPFGNETLTGTGTDWTQSIIDLSPYERQTVQIGFFAYANGGTNNTNLGLYVDDLSIE
ncbi:MAG TPA: choice-of-anchor J domain-containing protein [Polyangiaceae bacterium]|jgi:hypothetical protein|nr:choice-of-anchor J domain-containing protein [Polyangiaceae bacterium]